MKGGSPEIVTKLLCYARHDDSTSSIQLSSRNEGRMRDTFKSIRLGVREDGMAIMLKWLLRCTRGCAKVLLISPTQALRDTYNGIRRSRGFFLLGGSDNASQRLSPPWSPGIGYVSRKQSDLECDGADIE